MENLSRGTIKEICDTVYDDVMEEVTNNLSQMKPELIKMIVDEVSQKQAKVYTDKIHQLELRIAELEKSKSTFVQSTSVKTNKSGTTHSQKIDVSRIYGGFRFNGWIFYRNYEMANFLYKVRDDGSCNTQLTDYSVMGLFKISNNCLVFTDEDCKERKINLNIEE